MHSHPSNDRRLIELQPPRRNRYFGSMFMRERSIPPGSCGPRPT
jgi:hypothetical protein